MTDLFSKKQVEYIKNANAKWNIAHGPVRSGKTVGSIFRFLTDAIACPDSAIYIVGHTFDTAYRNVVRKIMESTEFEMFRPFCNWSGKKLYFRDKVIGILGAKDEGAIGNFQGDTHSLTYCDEITLYPDSIIDMIDTRLSCDHSKAHATCNPSFPTHKVKQWIDKAKDGDENYYEIQITLDDNPYVPQHYKDRIRNSLSGVFYKRNYLGLWCLAEGAIFDFFDRKLHIIEKPPGAEYYIAGIDYGASNPFACLLIGVSTGKYTQTGKHLWVDQEYYWDPKATQLGKTNSEFAHDVHKFLEDYNVRQIYIDPSAASFKREMQRLGLTTIDANNEVLDGITMVTSEMRKGNLTIRPNCKNLIREIESYVWDKKASEKGDDKPVKSSDHACVTGETIITTHAGEFCIKDLVGKRSIVNAYNIQDEEFVESYIENIQMTKNAQKILKLTLENGKALRATEDHKVHTKDGYIEIRNLLPTHEVLCTDPMFSRVKLIEDDGVEDVYCLSNPITGNFIANGIVVKNCDALRYAIATHRVSEYNPYKDQERAEEWRKNKYDHYRK